MLLTLSVHILDTQRDVTHKNEF